MSFRMHMAQAQAHMQPGFCRTKSNILRAEGNEASPEAELDSFEAIQGWFLGSSLSFQIWLRVRQAFGGPTRASAQSRQILAPAA